jgi:hypothetical protein
MDYIRRCAMMRAVRHEAARWGYQGDLLAERVPLVGTVNQQHHLMTIYHDIEPRPRTEKEREFVKRLCRAAVLGEQPAKELITISSNGKARDHRQPRRRV